MAPPDDDDAVIVPAPDRAVFKPKSKPPAAPARTQQAAYQTLHFRQTVIPVMLTLGIIALVLAAIRLGISDDSVFAKIPASVAGVLSLVGVLLLAVAGLNMMQVKQILDGKR
jgi:hypothetical protein